jgi:hypothetical protein
MTGRAELRQPRGAYLGIAPSRQPGPEDGGALEPMCDRSFGKPCVWTWCGEGPTGPLTQRPSQPGDMAASPMTGRRRTAAGAHGR